MKDEKVFEHLRETVPDRQCSRKRKRPLTKTKNEKLQKKSILIDFG